MRSTKDWPDWITYELVVAQHDLLVQKYGGSYGIRDKGLLESAIVLPAQTVFGEPMYPTPHDQAAAFAVSMICNHPFMDGNKRIAIRIAKAWLRYNGCICLANEDETYDFIIQIAEGKIDMDAAKAWYRRYFSFNFKI